MLLTANMQADQDARWNGAPFYSGDLAEQALSRNGEIVKVSVNDSVSC